MGVKLDKGWDDVPKELMKVVNRKTIHDRLSKGHGKEIINAVVGSAKAGVGPGNKKYPPYSKSYTRQLGLSRGRVKGGDIKNWLHLSGAMLEKGNFGWEVASDGKLFMVWTAPNDKVGTYAEVHQEGLPLGKNGPKKQRKWLHFETTASAKAVVKAYEATIGEMVLEFNAGRTL
jgi:hypothetical protein